jgi:hypothetical protein
VSNFSVCDGTTDTAELPVQTWADFLDELRNPSSGVTSASPGGCGACSGCLTMPDGVLAHV